MTQEITIAIFTTCVGLWFMQGTICAYLITKIKLMKQQNKTKEEFLQAQTKRMNQKTKETKK